MSGVSRGVLRWMALAALAAPVAAQDGRDATPSVALSPEAMLDAASRFEKAGDLASARTFYLALSKDPRSDVRIEAQFRLARMEADAGRLREAAVMLRAIVDERPDAMAARGALAALLARMGDEDAALRELRALQASRLPAEVALQLDGFANALRSRRPFSLDLEIALAPDSNINNATSKDALGTVLGDFTIDEESKQRSGIGLSIKGQAVLRHALDEEFALLAAASASGDFYRDKQFNLTTLDLGAGPEWRHGSHRVAVDIGQTRRWFGMEPYERRWRMNGQFSRSIDRQTLGRARLSVGKIDNRLNDLADGRFLTVGLSAERALSATTGVSLGLTRERVGARDAAYSTTGWSLDGGGWAVVGRATFHAFASRGWLAADARLALLPERREDRSLRLGFGATWRRAQLLGFAPLARVVIERNRSSVAFYDYSGRRLELGVVRAF